MQRAFAAGMACVLLAGAVHAAPATRARWLMGTLWTVRAEAADSARAGVAVEAALDTVASLERRLSNWSPSSELSRLNAAGSGVVSAPLFDVLDSALSAARETDGASDPTVESLTLAWDLRGNGRVPSASELATARAHVGWRHVSLDPARSFVDLGGTRIDLGGIAKGFALDRAAHVLRERGVESASLDAGGQQLWLGRRARDVWVAHPTDRERAAVRLALEAGSLSTSGQSEHTLEAGGRRIGHVLDPRTGQPLGTRASVSALTTAATGADAYSTALLVMGRERARSFAAGHPGLGVLWLEPAGARVTAEAWGLEVRDVASFVTLHHSPAHPVTGNSSRP
jgi:thiamine biosynthesis lipoprotein